VTTLRYGVVGTGMMGVEHIHSANAIPGCTVVALADPDPGSLAAGRAAAGSRTECFTDARSMLSALELDVVVVATPNYTHHAVLEQIWGAPCNILLEKPLCTTLPDSLSLASAAAKHPGLVWMGLDYRFIPAIQALLSELGRGTAGNVRMVAIREHRFPFLRKVGDWNRFNRYTGGTLVEKCCHFFDLMNLMTGRRPLWVTASGGHDLNHLDESYEGEAPDMLDNAFVIVEYEGGVRASLDLCMFAEASRFEQEVCVVGDAGKLEARIPGFMESARRRKAELVVGSRGPDWPVETRAVPDDPSVRYRGNHHGSTYLEHLALRDAIVAGVPAAVTVADGIRSVALGVAAQRSIEEGRVIAIDELGLGDWDAPG
jgi:predicted dehydrogenase